MSMSTYIVGIKPPDGKWKAMKKVYDSCKAANLDPPEEVWKFFDNEEPDPEGVIVDLAEHFCVTEWSTEGSEGFQVEIAKLPKDIKILRFYNSW